MLIILPFLFIKANEYFNLPVYVNYSLMAFGAILILSGIFIFFYCYNLFSHHGKGTPVETEPTLRFVSSGIYNFMRNPIYIGYFLIILGEFFILGYLLLILYVLMYMIFIHFFVVYHEEPILRKKFGSEYIRYTKKVPRWIFF